MQKYVATGIYFFLVGTWPGATPFFGKITAFKFLEGVVHLANFPVVFTPQAPAPAPALAGVV